MLLPIEGFADDLKFVADLSLHTKAEVLSEMNKFAKWAQSHHMQLSKEKMLATQWKETAESCIYSTR